MSAKKIIIQGVTREGRKFRPSDWAERLYHATASYGPDRRPKFPPYVKMLMREGLKCIEVDRRMEDSNPLLYDFLVGFARQHDLAMVDPGGAPVTLETSR